MPVYCLVDCKNDQGDAACKVWEQTKETTCVNFASYMKKNCAKVCGFNCRK